MRTFHITSIHDVYKDSYKEGEQEAITSYILDEIVEAQTILEAIEIYFKDNLGYSFDKDLSNIKNNILHYSVLVDADSIEVNDEQKELWKKELIDLYTDNITITVKEVVDLFLF